uniref:Ankyrin repeat protein n=1 Tax=Emiliania huxleyi (strain CCMP1516) TaxID=280463 RepID=A0A0D3JII0_EMIH1
MAAKPPREKAVAEAAPGKAAKVTAAAAAAAPEADEATTETAPGCKLADKRRRKKENAREKQRRELEEDALLQDRIREDASKEKAQLAEAKEEARLAADTTKLTKVAASPPRPPPPRPRPLAMAERCFTHAPSGLVKQIEVFEEVLREMVRDGDVDAVEGILDAGLDVSAPQETDGRTLLFHACRYNQPAMAELLLQRGATVDVEALNVAAILRRPALVRLLLDPKWDVDYEVVDSALINVERMTDGKIHEGPISPSEPKVSDVLLAFREAGFCREKGFVLYRSAMEFTQVGGPPTVVEMYLDAGLDVNFSVPVAEDTITLLALACENGNAEVASLLLSRGAVESSALCRAVVGRHADVVRVLLAAGPSRKYIDEAAHLAGHVAEERKLYHCDVLQAFLEAGYLCFYSARGVTDAEADPEVVEAYLNAGGDVNYSLVPQQRVAIVRELIEYGAASGDDLGRVLFEAEQRRKRAKVKATMKLESEIVKLLVPPKGDKKPSLFPGG